MKTLTIQAEEDEHGVLHKELITTELRQLGFSPEIKAHFDDEHDVNFYIDTEDLKGVWEAIKDKLIPISAIANSCTILCQGQCAWADMLILHAKNDPEIELDEL